MATQPTTGPAAVKIAYTDAPIHGRLVEVTPSMIAAGVSALREMPFGQNLSDIVRNVFFAMAYDGLDVDG